MLRQLSARISSESGSGMTLEYIMPSGDCKLKVQLNACTDKYIDVFHDLSIKLKPQLN